MAACTIYTEKQAAGTGAVGNITGQMFVSSKLQPGVFSWLLNSLSLIVMPLCDLHKQTRPSMIGQTTTYLVDLIAFNQDPVPIGRACVYILPGKVTVSCTLSS